MPHPDRNRAACKALPRGYRRDRDCLTCKARHVKCDLNRPACGPCGRAGLACQGYEIRIRWSSEAAPPKTSHRSQKQRAQLNEAFADEQGVLNIASEYHTSKPPTPDAEAAIVSDTSSVTSAIRPPSNDSNWTTHYQNYLDFFSQKFEEAKIRRGGAGVPGLQSDLSGIWQLVWYRITGDMHQQPKACRAEPMALYASALRELNQALKRNDILALFGIVTLSFLDTCEGPFINIRKHLLGAKALLDLHCDGPEKLGTLCSDIPGFRQAISLLVWYDIMGAFLKIGYVVILEDWYRESMDEEFFQMVHCPKDTLELYVAIVQSRRGLANPKIQLLAMMQLLLADESGIQPDHSLKCAWRIAAAMAALALDTSKQNHEVAEIVSMLADRLARCIESIPSSSMQYRHLLCPVTVLRAMSSSQKHHQVAENYFATCESLSRPMYLNGRAGCDEYWMLVLN